MTIKRFLSIAVLICICVAVLFISNYIPNSNKTVIKFSTWGSKSEIDIVRDIISKFENEHSDIKVELIHIPENYFQKLHLLFAAGIEPDVVFFNNQNIKMYIKAGLLEDLSPYFSDLTQNFYIEVLNCFKKDEKLFAIPRDISNFVIYYNKDIFREQNVKMPKKIKDIFELREIAKSVKTENNYGINFEEKPTNWLNYLASNGGGILSDDGEKILINSPKSIEALNLYADMINKDKSMPTKVEIGSMTTAQMFINSKIAMYLSGRWMSPKFREVITFDWDVVEFPAPNKLYIDSSGWAITKKSKHKKQAAEFIKYLSDRETMEKFALTGLIIPARKNVILQIENQKPLNYKAFTNMLNKAKPTPVNENYSSILDFLMERTEQLFSGKKRAEEVFDDNTIIQLQKLCDNSNNN